VPLVCGSLTPAAVAVTSCSAMRRPTAAGSNGVQLCILSLGLGCPHQVLLTPFLFRVDHLRSVELCASALQVACHLLASHCNGSSAPGGGAASGTFVTKLWAGGEQQPLLADMRSRFSPFPSLSHFHRARVHACTHARTLARTHARTPGHFPSSHVLSTVLRL
jgi:hypothetical protein